MVPVQYFHRCAVIIASTLVYTHVEIWSVQCFKLRTHSQQFIFTFKSVQHFTAVLKSYFPTWRNRRPRRRAEERNEMRGETWRRGRLRSGRGRKRKHDGEAWEMKDVRGGERDERGGIAWERGGRILSLIHSLKSMSGTPIHNLFANRFHYTLSSALVSHDSLCLLHYHCSSISHEAPVCTPGSSSIKLRTLFPTTLMILDPTVCYFTSFTSHWILLFTMI